ncbi:unnamed protein product [Cylicostephanus goldi]|uniref:Uncharacterized protein n=1 Tax=Cylicostephanus goldi TaxID=71465 RepID=A0A3P7MNQ3_CYLGO|nr:unnamed protein product [Cylicostephanus goldi]
MVMRTKVLHNHEIWHFCEVLQDRNCEVGFNDLHGNRQGPLTSTPIASKGRSTFEKFLGTNCVTDKPSVVNKVSNDVQMNDSYVRPQQKKSAVTTVPESSFAVVGRSVVDGLKAVNRESFHVDFEEDDHGENLCEQPAEYVDDQVSDAERVEVVPQLPRVEPNIVVNMNSPEVIIKREEENPKVEVSTIKSTVSLRKNFFLETSSYAAEGYKGRN